MAWMLFHPKFEDSIMKAERLGLPYVRAHEQACQASLQRFASAQVPEHIRGFSKATCQDPRVIVDGDSGVNHPLSGSVSHPWGQGTVPFSGTAAGRAIAGSQVGGGAYGTPGGLMGMPLGATY